ncbi:MAG TPA: 2-C-methyl-D-erythritol 4-phosphate cytidylyltransferase [Solirubrobacteraceae bacterium]|jgi:2-C-methyl-D-erythritol 4-phosphate cytidylyltransferase
MAVALVVAAGRGERLGSAGPKTLIEIAGRPMLEWSLDALRAVAAIEQIVVALPAGVSAPSGCVGVSGGEVRSASVRAALSGAGDGDPVLVHDGARPLVTAELIEAVLDGLGAADCAVAASAVTDTIKEADADGNVVGTLDRSRLWSVQTPQVFRRDALERALSLPEHLVAAATDEAWLVEQGGGSVRVVAAPAENIKVTTPRDLALAELLLAARVD